MEYKTELHCHSRDASGCSSESAEGIVTKYVKAGYTTVCLTNHFSPSGNDEAEWENKIERLYRAYDILKEAAGDSLNILMGMELRFYSNYNDYLVFGIDRKYLSDRNELFKMGIGSFTKMAREDGLFTIQAHPFRFGMTTVDPRHIDAVEVFNGHPGHNSNNDIAESWADKYGLIKTSGTDHHNPDHMPDGGIITEKPIKTVDELINTLKSGEYKLIKTPNFR